MYRVKIMNLLNFSTLLCQHNVHSDRLAKMGTYIVYVDLFNANLNFK